MQLNYIERKRKEELAFLVVKFLKAYSVFNEIYTDFKRYEKIGKGFVNSGLFEKIKFLEEKLVYDIKEKAHFLYRSTKGADSRSEDVDNSYKSLQKLLSSKKLGSESRNIAIDILTEIRRSLINQSIDSYIGTGFHIFMILRESVYQLEFYVPQYIQERQHIRKIESLSRKLGYVFSAEEMHELDHIKEIDELSRSLVRDTKRTATRSIERCKSLFERTAEILKHVMKESEENEILILNLIKEKKLLEKIYRPEGVDEIFSDMYKHTDIPGRTGVDRALNYIKKYSGNITGIIQ